MDRSLDEVISERQRNRSRNQRGRRDAPRDGVRKSQRDEPRNLDRDWVHDRFDDDPDSRRSGRNYRADRDRYTSRNDQPAPSGAKIRVDNLHYDLTEDDLKELFSRIGSIQSVQLLYDRQDRSKGIAFVTYNDLRDAKDALREFDGANAYGQPIKLTLVPASTKPARNPFDTAIPPGRSLADRIESPAGGRRRGNDDRSASPPKGRRSDVSKPAPEHIDRYVPGQRSRGGARGGGRNDSGRRPGVRRDQSQNQRKEDQGRSMVQGRPRKTAEELDAEMADYWGGGTPTAEGAAEGGNAAPASAPAPAAASGDQDEDMVL